MSSSSPLNSDDLQNSSSSRLNVTVTPPSPTHHHLRAPNDPSSNTTATTTSRRHAALMKRFLYEYTNFVNFKHSIYTSASNADPEGSILVELEQLKVWTSRAMAFVMANLECKQNALEMIDKTNMAISKGIDHIQSRIRILSPPSSPVIHIKKQRGKKKPRTTRLRDEKQARDSIRRIVVKFYLRDYLGVQFSHTVPTTFTCAAQFISNNKHLFESEIDNFGKTMFPNLPSPSNLPLGRDNEHVVRAFIQHCHNEMHDIITYLIFLLRKDANECNYDNSRFDSVPSTLMDKIRIRLVKDPNYDSFEGASPDLLKACKTSRKIFQSVSSSSSSSSNSSAANSESDTEIEDGDHDMLVIDE